MPRAEKDLMREELREFLRSGANIFMAEYSGVEAGGMNVFRRNLGKEGASCRVFKNTLITAEFSEKPWNSMLDSVSGPTLLVSAPGNPVGAAKVVSGFADVNKGVKLKAGLVERSFVTGEEISQIAKLPSRRELLSRLLGGFMSPVARFIGAVNAPVGAFISVLNLISKQTGGEKDGREGN